MMIFHNYNQCQLCFMTSIFHDIYLDAISCYKVNMKTFGNILFDEHLGMFLVDIKFPYKINNATHDRIYICKYLHFGRNHFPDNSV